MLIAVGMQIFVMGKMYIVYRPISYLIELAATRVEGITKKQLSNHATQRPNVYLFRERNSKNHLRSSGGNGVGEHRGGVSFLQAYINLGGVSFLSACITFEYGFAAVTVLKHFSFKKFFTFKSFFCSQKP